MILRVIGFNLCACVVGEIKQKNDKPYNSSLNDYVSVVPARMYQKEQSQSTRRPQSRVYSSSQRVKTLMC